MPSIKYKDSTTGNMLPVSVKVGDTLPVGTEIDYDGESVPLGWEQVADGDLIVSATEPSGNDRRKVWFQHENIFDNTASKTYNVATNFTTIPTGVRATTTTGENNTFACIDIGAISDYVGKEIYVKFKNASSTNKGRIYLGKSNVGQTSRQAIVDSSSVDNGTHILKTDTIQNDTTYPRLFLAIYSNGGASSVSANTYVDYTDLIVGTVEDETYILNANDEYEKYNDKDEIIEDTQTEFNNSTYASTADATFYINNRVVDALMVFTLVAYSSPAGYLKIASGLKYKPKHELFLISNVLTSNGTMTGNFALIQIKANGDIYLKTNQAYGSGQKIYISLTYITND